MQNIMALRFANGLFEPIWNRDRIDHVQITVAETIGVESAANSTKRPARCATWCPIMSSSLSPWWRWSRRSAFDAGFIRAKKGGSVHGDAP